MERPSNAETCDVRTKCGSGTTYLWTDSQQESSRCHLPQQPPSSFQHCHWLQPGSILSSFWPSLGPGIQQSKVVYNTERKQMLPVMPIEWDLVGVEASLAEALAALASTECTRG